MSGTPASLWESAKGGALCLLCARRCVIPERGRGFCGVRVLEGASLKTLNYGYAGAMNLDPVEKKPLYHYKPGTLTFSIGAPGCNLDCLGCQNHSLSRPGPNFRGSPP
ncbi:MAG: AmmeMemoRadiSam system radical SAM enzyme, partial [Deltaproteobacteria bacterium]|nr:AmmeMemoRadiSam system radical SAM enzyme [Deltaproteobacteria bacterium]